MKRQLRTRLSAVQPSLQLRKETEVFEKKVHSPKYRVGEPVNVLILRQGKRWIPGVVVNVLNRNYSVQMDGIVTKRHEHQLRSHFVSSVQKSIPILNPLEGLPISVNAAPSSAPVSKTSNSSVDDTNLPDVSTAEIPAEQTVVDPAPPPPERTPPKSPSPPQRTPPMPPPERTLFQPQRN